MRKQLQAEHGKQDLVDQINAEKKLRQTQMNRIVEMKRRIEDLNTRNRERREVDEKKMEEEKKFLNFQNEHLKTFFRQIDEKTTWYYKVTDEKSEDIIPLNNSISDLKFKLIYDDFIIQIIITN